VDLRHTRNRQNTVLSESRCALIIGSFSWNIVSKNWIKQLHTFLAFHFNRCLKTVYSETTAHFNGNFDTDNQIYLPWPKCTATFRTHCSSLKRWREDMFWRSRHRLEDDIKFDLKCTGQNVYNIKWILNLKDQWLFSGRWWVFILHKGSSVTQTCQRFSAPENGSALRNWLVAWLALMSQI
jgi:hypothetical protein